MRSNLIWVVAFANVSFSVGLFAQNMPNRDGPNVEFDEIREIDRLLPHFDDQKIPTTHPTKLKVPAKAVVCNDPPKITPDRISSRLKKRRIASESPEVRKLRLKHAKELLGKYYRRSIVRTGEKVQDVGEFVLTTLQSELPKRWTPKAMAIQKTLVNESEKYRFDPIFLLAVIANESRFNPGAVGGVGELGLMQIRPATAKWICEKYGLAWKGKRSLRDPMSNIQIGAAFLDYLRDDFEQHGRLYLAAYNMGQKNVRQALDNGVWPKDYAIRVMEHYIRLYTELNEASVATEKSKPSQPNPSMRAPAHADRHALISMSR